MGQHRALVFKGDSGEVEIKPQADTRLYLLSNGQREEQQLKRSRSERVTSVAGELSTLPLQELWRGSSQDAYGLDATLATAAAALLLLEPQRTNASARQQAGALWQQRDRSRLD
jgi:anthranilate phosphoribosyltransferase